MRVRRFTKEKNKGNVLLASLMMIALVSMIVVGTNGSGGFLQSITQEHYWVQRGLARAQALEIAEAGLQQALKFIRDNFETVAQNGYDSGDTAFNNGTYRVTSFNGFYDTNAVAGSLSIQSVGTVTMNGVSLRRVIWVNVVQTNENPFAIYARTKISALGHTAVYGVPVGGIHTDRNFWINGPPSTNYYTLGSTGQKAGVILEAYHTSFYEHMSGLSSTTPAPISAANVLRGSGSIPESDPPSKLLQDGYVIASSVRESSPEFGFKRPDFNAIISKAASTGKLTAYSGSKTFNNETIGGPGQVVYIQGTKTNFNGNVTAQGTIICDNECWVYGSVNPPMGGTLEIMSKGQFTLCEKDLTGPTDQPQLKASVYVNDLDNGSVTQPSFRTGGGYHWLQGSIMMGLNMWYYDGGGTLSNGSRSGPFIGVLPDLRVDFEKNPNTNLRFIRVKNWREVPESQMH